MPYDNRSELFYHVDTDDNVLGSISREAAHSDSSKIHRTVDILVIDKNKLLLQKRSKHKDTFPNYWSISAGGHVTYGQTYEEAAKRELKEELGIELSITPKVKHFFDTGIEQEYSYIFEANYDGSCINFDQTEVEDILWIAINDLEKFVLSNNITPSARQVLSLVGYITKV